MYKRSTGHAGAAAPCGKVVTGQVSWMQRSIPGLTAAHRADPLRAGLVSHLPMEVVHEIRTVLDFSTPPGNDRFRQRVQEGSRAKDKSGQAWAAPDSGIPE